MQITDYELSRVWVVWPTVMRWGWFQLCSLIWNVSIIRSALSVAGTGAVTSQFHHQNLNVNSFFKNQRWVTAAIRAMPSGTFWLLAQCFLMLTWSEVRGQTWRTLSTQTAPELLAMCSLIIIKCQKSGITLYVPWSFAARCNQTEPSDLLIVNYSVHKSSLNVWIIYSVCVWWNYMATPLLCCDWQMSLLM